VAQPFRPLLVPVGGRWVVRSEGAAEPPYFPGLIEDRPEPVRLHRLREHWLEDEMNPRWRRGEWGLGLLRGVAPLVGRIAAFDLRRVWSTRQQSNEPEREQQWSSAAQPQEHLSPCSRRERRDRAIRFQSRSY